MLELLSMIPAWAWIGIGIVVVLCVIVAFAPIPYDRGTCPRCGDEMVAWKERRTMWQYAGGASVQRTYEFDQVGCPKVRDRVGAGSGDWPEDEWQEHAVRVVRARRLRSRRTRA